MTVTMPRYGIVAGTPQVLAGRTTPVVPRGRSRAPAAAADLANDRRGADDRHGGAGGGDRRVLAVNPPAGYRVVPGPLVEQYLQGARVVVARPPASLAQRLAVDDPRVHDVAQVG